MGIMDYIKPELITASIAIYFLGKWVKKSERIKDKYIPIVIGIVGMILATIYVVATSTFTNWQSVLMAIFASIVQGILVAGLSTYVNQIIKQRAKEE